jgi:hypothetical protein
MVKDTYAMMTIYPHMSLFPAIASPRWSSDSACWPTAFVKSA